MQYTDDVYDVQWDGIIESVQIEELHDFSRLFIFILGEERGGWGDHRDSKSKERISSGGSAPKVSIYNKMVSVSNVCWVYWR